MKILEKDRGVVDIFAIYVVTKDVMCLGFPRSNGGLLAYKMKEVTVIDPTLSGKFIYYQNDNGYGIYHWALIEEGLLDDLSELDETAYYRFLKILKEEGSIGADFY